MKSPRRMNSGSESVPSLALPDIPPLSACASAWKACASARILSAPPQQPLAGGGQCHASRRPLEQCEVELVLQCADLRRQRGLADVQLLGRTGQVAGLGDDHEAPEAVEVHRGFSGSGPIVATIFVATMT